MKEYKFYKKIRQTGDLTVVTIPTEIAEKLQPGKAYQFTIEDDETQ